MSFTKPISPHAQPSSQHPLSGMSCEDVSSTLWHGMVDDVVGSLWVQLQMDEAYAVDVLKRNTHRMTRCKHFSIIKFLRFKP